MFLSGDQDDYRGHDCGNHKSKIDQVVGEENEPSISGAALEVVSKFSKFETLKIDSPSTRQ